MIQIVRSFDTGPIVRVDIMIQNAKGIELHDFSVKELCDYSIDEILWNDIQLFEELKGKMVKGLKFVSNGDSDKTFMLSLIF